MLHIYGWANAIRKQKHVDNKRDVGTATKREVGGAMGFPSLSFHGLSSLFLRLCACCKARYV